MVTTNYRWLMVSIGRLLCHATVHLFHHMAFIWKILEARSIDKPECERSAMLLVVHPILLQCCKCGKGVTN